MLEIPESKTINIQACNVLINKVISGVHPLKEICGSSFLGLH